MSCLSFSFEAKVEVVVYLAENLNNKTNKILNITLQGIPSGFDIMSRPKINQSLDKNCYNPLNIDIMSKPEGQTRWDTLYWLVLFRVQNDFESVQIILYRSKRSDFLLCKTLFEQVQINNLCWTVKKLDQYKTIWTCLKPFWTYHKDNALFSSFRIKSFSSFFKSFSNTFYAE